MPKTILEGFDVDSRYIDRINEILDAYRIKLTGSLECRKEGKVYDFIYREQPNFCGEILMIMYQIGYEDGQRDALRESLISNTHNPDPRPPAGAAAVKPYAITEAVGGGYLAMAAWPTVLGIKAPPEDDVWSYSDYRKDKIWQALERIAKRRGIKIMVCNFEKYRDTVLGFCVNEELTIVINERVPNRHKPVVLAHELAHFKLHGNLDRVAYMKDDSYHNEIEREAERFAKRLRRFIRKRLPKPQLPPGYKSINTVEGWNELARRTREKKSLAAA